MKINRTRYLALSFVVMLVVTLLPTPYFAEPAKQELPGIIHENIEIPEDAVYISTEADLLALAENCRLDTWSVGKTVVLNNDIVLESTEFQGISTFGGTFLGQGHSIEGLCLKEEGSVVGFFRYLQKTAVVMDFSLEGEIIPEGTKSTVGAFAGENAGLILNVSFKGNVSGASKIGGIVGNNASTGVIYNVTVTGSISGTHFVGGVAGENHGIIRDCKNEALINTEALQNDISLDEISTDSIFSTEITATATNIGGIVGTNSGVIRSCINNGLVGYKNMGNNVGGIAGSQNGYIVDCINYAEINGRKEVGGIVGQIEPNILLDYDRDSLQIMSAQMADLEDQLHSIGEDLDFGGDLKIAMENDWSATFEKTEGAVNQAGNIVETAGNAGDNVGIFVGDVSGEDTINDTVGKVANCENYGAIKGSTALGGIAGAIAKETDLDEEEDMNVSGESSLNVKYEAKAVIRNCTNQGKVSTSKEMAGGIVGQMTMGAVFDCTNYGGVDGLNADYVGGIAGDSLAIIRSCNNRGAIAGADYVGGIAGRGYEVKNSYVFSEILAYREKGGAILGYVEKDLEEDALIANNRYVVTAEDMGGIDSISYTGVAEAMTLAELLELETIPEGFDTVTITFKTEGRNDVKIHLPVGESLPMEQVPVLSTEFAKEYGWVKVPPVTSEVLAMGETATRDYLSETDLTNIYFDKTFEATFDTKGTVVKTTEVSVDNRPILLAEGVFARDTKVILTDCLAAIPEVDGKNAKVHYAVTLSNTGVEKLHYLIPETIDTEKVLVLVKNQEGIWSERAFVVEGSYMVFDFLEGDESFALVGDTMALVLDVAKIVGFVLVFALVISFGSKFLKRKKKNN